MYTILLCCYYHMKTIDASIYGDTFNNVTLWFLTIVWVDPQSGSPSNFYEKSHFKIVVVNCK